MEKLLYLNDLLKLDDAELNNTKIRFTQSNGKSDPLGEYLDCPDLINVQAFFWRTEQRYFKVGQTAICLLKLTNDTWLLTTIKEITNELGVTKGINYEGKELERFQAYFGRVVVRYHKKHQAQGRYAKHIMDMLEVAQILPALFDGDEFPGYDKVRLSFSQLETIITRSKRDWVAALENQKAVYLITDTNNGKQYVGSAYGENGMLLSRWRSYVENGHGGNKELVEIVKRLGFDYVKQHFQYSILENYNARVDKGIILERESWWKATLRTRNFGYNRN